MSGSKGGGAYHSKHNVRSVPVEYDGMFADMYPEWYATRLAVLRSRKGERYPVHFDP